MIALDQTNNGRKIIIQYEFDVWIDPRTQRNTYAFVYNFYNFFTGENKNIVTEAQNLTKKK